MSITIPVYFNFCVAGEDGELVRTNHHAFFQFDTNVTYEGIINRLIQDEFLLPLDIHRMRYNLDLRESGGNPMRRRTVTLHEGQTLGNIGLIEIWPSQTIMLKCAISIEIRNSQSPKVEPISTPPSLGETIITSLTSREATAIANFVTIATGLTACIGVLRLVAKQWSEKRSANPVSSQESSSQPSGSDFVAIHLRMTHGPDHEFEEWLTSPDRLKHYIDVFNQPSSSIQPLHAIFVQRNGKAYKVDVSKGTQNNPQLDELLSYLKSDSAEQ